MILTFITNLKQHMEETKGRFGLLQAASAHKSQQLSIGGIETEFREKPFLFPMVDNLRLSFLLGFVWV